MRGGKPGRRRSSSDDDSATVSPPPRELALLEAHASSLTDSPISGTHSHSPRPPRISDPAMAALNAAALQTINSGTSQTQTYKLTGQGNMTWTKQKPVLEGIRSTDVSFFADRVGHGQLQVARSPSRKSLVPQPPDPICATIGIGSPRSRAAKDKDKEVGAPPCSRTRSMVKVPSWQCPRSAPVPPQGAPGGSGRLGTPRVRPSHWAPRHHLGCSSQPLPKPLYSRIEASRFHCV